MGSKKVCIWHRFIISCRTRQYTAVIWILLVMMNMFTMLWLNIGKFEVNINAISVHPLFHHVCLADDDLFHFCLVLVSEKSFWEKFLRKVVTQKRHFYDVVLRLLSSRMHYSGCDQKMTSLRRCFKVVIWSCALQRPWTKHNILLF